MKENTARRLITYIKEHFHLFIVIIIFSILSVIFQVLIPLEIAKMINGIKSFQPIDFNFITTRLMILVIYAVLAGLCQFIQSQATNKISFNITSQMREEVFYHIQDLPLKEIDKRSHGAILALAVNDVDLVNNGILQFFNSLFTGLTSILFVLVMMVRLNWKIAFLVVLLTPISLLVSTFIANRNYKRMLDQLSLRSELTAYSNEMLSNQDLVRSLNYKDRSIDRFQDINSQLHESGFWSQFYGATINPTTRLLNSMVYGAVGLAGAIAVFNGGLTVGSLTAFLAYVNQYTKPFNEISNVINEMQASLAAAQRIFTFLAIKKEEPSRDKKTIENIKGNISIEELNFSYSEDKPLIKDLNLQVNEGDTIAIVGPTGAGKSTIINLLMRFYDQNSGKIFIDGLDSLDMSRDYLRKNFGMVLQDSWIFQGTVRENIAYGRPGASDGEIIEAAKKANIHTTILRMEEGYDSLLEEGGNNISTGQQQLINIARIFLMDPQMLILDEATSSIDTMTEKRVQDAFDMMMEGKTSFIVAHRLSTVKNADTILYLEDGQVKEQGSHEELMEAKGKYHQMFTSQFENAKD